MVKLLYIAITSLDGYIEDESGGFDWAAPDQELHRFLNDLARPVGTYLYGRRMYETMMGWETDPAFAEQASHLADFAQIWQAADKVVYSTTLDAATTARTRVERTFDATAVRQLKATADRDLAIGGADLAAAAFRAGLVDECHLLLVPVIVGGGKRCYPAGLRVNLEQLDERRFENGWTYLRYRTV